MMQETLSCPPSPTFSFSSSLSCPPSPGCAGSRIAVSARLEDAIAEAEEYGWRSVYVSMDPERPQLIPTHVFEAEGSFEVDFANVVASLDEERPCLVLVPLQAAARDISWDEWLLLCWMPKDSLIEEKIRYTTAHQALRGSFTSLRFCEFVAEDRAEVSLGAVLARARPTVREEDNEVVFANSLDAKRLSSFLPKIDYGLRAPPMQTRSSFDEALGSVLAAEGRPGRPVAMLARIAVIPGAHGPRDGRELAAEVVSDMHSTLTLPSRLPMNEACFALLREPKWGDGLLLVVWLPHGAAPTERVVCCSSKVAVKSLVQQATDGEVKMVMVSELWELTHKILALSRDRMLT